MTIIEIAACENGAHRNQTGPDVVLPDGWAVVPENLLPVWQAHGPFVNVTASDGVVTSMTAGIVPEPVPEPEIETTEQRLSDIEDAIIELAAIIAGEEE